MDNLNRGDTVQLKSGGPIMTVNNISNDGMVFCQWFDGKEELKSGHFQREQLIKASAPKEWIGVA